VNLLQNDCSIYKRVVIESKFVTNIKVGGVDFHRDFLNSHTQRQPVHQQLAKSTERNFFRGWPKEPRVKETGATEEGYE